MVGVDFGFCSLFAVILVSVFVSYICHRYLKNDASVAFRKKNILFITAHPDDECMFFSPTVTSQVKRSSNLHLLCLTSGNYYEQGEVRKQELLASCGILGIPLNQVTVIDHRDLPDDPHVAWDVKIAGRIIRDHIKHNNIQVVVTFDSYGVSGHSNHIDTFKAVKRLKDEGMIRDVTVYVLESVNIVRKYLSFVDLPFSLLSRNIFLSSPQDLILAQKAMSAHASQFVWFRKLYIVFSRFMMINTLEEMQ